MYHTPEENAPPIDDASHPPALSANYSGISKSPELERDLGRGGGTKGIRKPEK